MSHEVGIVVQTHWDREWYFTREQFVARLLRVMPRVLDDLDAGRLQHFLFDGQVAAMQDLLERAEPDLSERMRAAVRAGRVQIGPWYVMADEFLCSGESLWRNLEMGLAISRELGSTEFVGYLPDSFGHIAQMPQLLRHFGIDSAVLWRGVDSPHSEFDWVAPDGSRVGTLFLPEGYYQHPFNLPEWQGPLAAHLDRIAPQALSGHLLLTQGGDHLLPSREFSARLAAFNAAQTAYRLHETTLPAHTATVLAATAGRRAEIHGELRDNALAFVLPDVLSTRRHLKLAHDRLEDRLRFEIEPLFARLAVPQPERALGQVWQTLLQQQAHDSICGCSVDAVHREMASRFAQLDERLTALRQQALADAGMVGELKHDGGPDPFSDDRRFTLFNPLPVARSGWHEVDIFLAGTEAPSGVRVPGHATRLLGCEPASEFHSPLDDFPDPVHGHRLRIAVQADLAGWQALPLGIEVCAAQASEGDEFSLDEQGRLTLNFDGVRLPLAIQTELDAGDTYNFSPPAEPAIRLHQRFMRVGPGRFAIEARVPAALNAERSGPSADEVRCHGELYLQRWPGSDFIRARLTWHNAARDQRTRLLIGLPQPVTESHADGGFAWLRRPLRAAVYPAAPSKREMPVAVQPSHSALAVGAVHLAHRAMPEFEWLPQALGDCPDTLGLTLVRSVGWLSRRDLRTRGVGAGPDLATPEAQCLGQHEFEFRLGGFAQPRHAALRNEAARLRAPVLALRGHGSAWREPETLAGTALQVSACRRVGRHMELRLWNPTDQTLPCALAGWQGPPQAGPHGIVTLTRPA